MSEIRDHTPSGEGSAAINPWWPTVRDPVLLAERRGRWRWPAAIIGTVICALLSVLLIGYLDQVMSTIAVRTGTSAAFERASDPKAFFLPGNVYTFLSLGLFGVILLMVATLLSRVHDRSPGFYWRFHGHTSAAAFCKATLAITIVALAGSGYEYLKNPANFAVRSTFGAPYWLWVAAGILALLVQTLGEEAIFRGYLLRVWGAVVPIRALVVAVIVTCFTSLHTVNSDFKTDVAYNFIAFLTGELVYYWVLFRTGSLSATWGLHFANNMMAGIILVTVPGSLPDMGLFVFTDPILSAGGSRLKSPSAYIELAVSIAALVTLLGWRRSPFYLAAAPLPAPPEPAPPMVEPAPELPPAPLPSPETPSV